MQIVISISKIEYEHLANKEKFYFLEKSKQEWLINKALNCIVNGVTLPKGYGRLIDADELLKRIAEKCKTPSLSDATINGLCGATAIIYDMLIESGQER